MAEKIETRTKYTAKNAFFSILKYVLAVITSFTLRSITLRFFGTEFVGLVSLCNNIISILAISELGIGTALVYKLYKPIAEDDKPQIKGLLSLYKKIYLIIGFIILCVGLIVMLFLNKLTDGGNLEGINTYIIFAIFLLTSVLTYFMAHRRALLFTSQKNYIEMLSIILATIVIFPLQVISIVVVKNVYFYAVCNILLILVELAVIYFATRKKYGDIMKAETEPVSVETKKELKKNTYALALNKISNATAKNSDSIVISSILGLSVLALYTNYMVIITYVFAISSLIFSAVRASVGNFIHTHSKEDSLKLFKTINFAFNWIITFCTTSMLVIFQPFMAVWSTISRVDMILPITIPIILSAYFYIDTSREVVRIFKETSGIFWEDRWAPIVATIVNVGLSIGLGILIGLEGILLATIISILSMPVWLEVRVLYKGLFKTSQKSYWADYARNMLICLVCCLLTYVINSLIPLEGWWKFIISVVLCLIIPNVVCLIYGVNSEEFISLKTYVKNFLSSKFKRKRK